MGRVGAGVALGMIFGPLIGTVTGRLGMWAPPLAAAALATLDLVGAFLWMPETRPASVRAQEPPHAQHRSFTALISEGRVVAILALFFLTFLYMTNLQVALALLVGDRLDWHETAVGIIFTAFGVLMLIIQGVLIGHLARAFGAKNLVAFGAIASGAGLMGIALAHERVPLCIGLVLLGIGLGVTQPLLSTIASETAGASRIGEVLGTAQSAGGFARMIGPALSGALYKRIAPGAPFVGGAIAALLALFIALGLRSAKRAPSETTTVPQ
jgi:predicted MFS family arabinose efflux permease